MTGVAGSTLHEWDCVEEPIVDPGVKEEQNEGKEGKSSSSLGPIIGGVVGGIVLLILVILLLVYCYRRKGTSTPADDEAASVATMRGAPTRQISHTESDLSDRSRKSISSQKGIGELTIKNPSYIDSGPATDQAVSATVSENSTATYDNRNLQSFRKKKESKKEENQYAEMDREAYLKAKRDKAEQAERARDESRGTITPD